MLLRYEDGRRGGESYRPSDRLGRRSPLRSTGFSTTRTRSPVRGVADTWVPPNRGRPRSWSRDNTRRRSRSPYPRGKGSMAIYDQRHPSSAQASQHRDFHRDSSGSYQRPRSPGSLRGSPLKRSSGSSISSSRHHSPTFPGSVEFRRDRFQYVPSVLLELLMT